MNYTKTPHRQKIYLLFDNNELYKDNLPLPSMLAELGLLEDPEL